MSTSQAQKLTGYARADGRFGIRNLVAVMAAQDTMNPMARALAARAPGVVCLPASYGRGQLGDDLELTLRTMRNLASHPNLAACLVVGFEPASHERIVLPAGMEGRGDDLAGLSFLEAGGYEACLKKGQAMLEEFLEKASAMQRRAVPLDGLCLGSECGGSDAYSGLLTNPAPGFGCGPHVGRGRRRHFFRTG